MPLYGLVTRTSRCQKRPSNGNLYLARFISTFLTWITPINGLSKMARKRCTSRWRWITQNAPLPYGTHSEIIGISPPIVESDAPYRRPPMLDTFKELIANQFDGAFSMLNACIDKCPETVWNSRVANYLFCQVAFHTLFWADFYLGQDDNEKGGEFRRQPFHRAKRAVLWRLRGIRRPRAGIPLRQDVDQS